MNKDESDSSSDEHVPLTKLRASLLSRSGKSPFRNSTNKSPARNGSSPERVQSHNEATTLKREVGKLCKDLKNSRTLLQESNGRVNIASAEVGRLREDLRVAKERADRVGRHNAELQRSLDEAQNTIRELRFGNNRLVREVDEAKDAALRAQAQTREVVGRLRESLSEVEQAAHERSSQSQAHLRSLSTLLHSLEKVVVSADAPTAIASVAQRLLTDINRIAQGLLQTQSTNGSAPSRNQDGTLNESLAERCGELEERNAQLQNKLDRALNDLQQLKGSTSSATAEAQGDANLIAQYRVAIVKARGQCAALRARIEELEKETQSLRDEHQRLRMLYKDAEDTHGVAILQTKRDVEDQWRQLTKDQESTRRRLEEELSSMQEKIEANRRAADQAHEQVHMLEAENMELKNTLSQLEGTVADLRATVGEQRADLQTALDLVMASRMAYRMPSSSALNNLPPTLNVLSSISSEASTVPPSNMAPMPMPISQSHSPSLHPNRPPPPAPPPLTSPSPMYYTIVRPLAPSSSSAQHHPSPSQPSRTQGDPSSIRQELAALDTEIDELQQSLQQVTSRLKGK